jgi:hypothetical protein
MRSSLAMGAGSTDIELSSGPGADYGTIHPFLDQ